MSAREIIALRAAGFSGVTLTELTDHVVAEVGYLRAAAQRNAQALANARADASRCREQIAAVRRTLRDHNAPSSGDLASAVGVALSRASRGIGPTAPKRGDLVPVAVDLGALTHGLRIRFLDD